ncbi:MAG TPA: STAS-like domain-containing protein [Mycobacteriales bacterium]|nr:STAS-like domain-containing protein [Mycobacteriales bacterium]
MAAIFRHRVSQICGPDDVAPILAVAKRARSSGALTLDLSATGKVFPNGAVPLATALQYFKREGPQVRTGEISEQVRRTHLLDPLNATPEALATGPLTNVVWRYRDEREAIDLCNRFVDVLEENVECEQGVIEALNWCLFEVLDNVFQHSHASCGYAMMQVHRKNRWCAVAVSDDGIGIHRSFVDNNVHSAKDAYEAIMLAIQERVTSKAKNMGNGLYGLMRVVGLNMGELEIRSGRGFLAYRAGKLSGSVSNSWPLLDAADHQGTTVDWQLDLARRVSLAEALNVTGMADLRIEDLEDSTGQHVVRVADFEEGLGTRRSAEQVRTKLSNLLNEGVPVLALDFDGVNVVSSSFADEVLGKLALEMGVVNFFARFRLVHMSETVHALVNRAIEQRVAEGDLNFPGTARN